MKNNKRHIDDTFLFKFLMGETNRDEQQLVISWLDEKEENRRHLDELEALWLESGKLNPRPIPVDKKKAWAKLSNRINQYGQDASSSMQPFSRFRLAVIGSVAASILALLGLFNWYVDDALPQEDYLLANSSQSILQDTLPDGSAIYLNQLAQISYQTSEINQRIVRLKGEAFFKVKRDTLRPFIVYAGIGGVKVLGTRFQVKPKKNGDIAVDVNSGRVELFLPDSITGDTLHLILTKGESGLISKQQDTIIRLASKSSAFFWFDKRLSFRNRPLKDVFEVLEDCYGIKIKTDNPNIGNLYYSSSFIDEDVEKVIQVISNTFDLTYTKEGDTFTLSDSKKNE